MANKRKLKKQIKYVTSELFAECICASTYSTRADRDENLKALLLRVVALNNDYLNRVSHPEPGMAPKNYYHVLINSFNKDINEVVDLIGNMLN